MLVEYNNAITNAGVEREGDLLHTFILLTFIEYCNFICMVLSRTLKCSLGTFV